MNDLPGEKPSILLVDDEPAVRQLLFDILSTLYRCQIADSAEAALGVLAKNRFNLVISDINLGGMTGVEMIPHVQRVSPDTVVMMISGSGTLDTAVEAMRTGSFDYLKKPFQLAHVLAAVRRAIEHQSLIASKREYEQDLERLVEERTARMNYLEYHDVLTNLPNKVLLEDRLEQLVLGCSQDCQIAVVLVLIDRLRSVRDAVGDTFGDHILLEGVQRFYECAGEGTTVGRLDSEVLAALLPDAVAENVIRLAERLNERIGSSFTVEGETFYVEGKIGVSLYPSDGSTAAELIKNARAALSRARELPGPTVQFFTNEITRSATARLALENDLRAAIEREELNVHYQPKVDIASGQITGVESLVRWKHPVRGNISPVEFIPIAEETGLIRPIGEFVLRRSCLDIKRWPALQLAVNLSRSQLQQESLSDRISEILVETGYDSALLNLEITESSIMQDEDAAVRLLAGFREFGMQISIDDFGTGYSSLSSLIQLPIDVLKIDRRFIRNAVENEDDASLVKAIVDLAHTLRLKVVAEGVEMPEQLELLRTLGCDEYQGFWFSRPLPIEELESKLSEIANES